MEWLQGEELTQRLVRGPLSQPEPLVLLERVTVALSVAYQRSVVHRGFKPSNLFLQGGRTR